MMEVGGIFIGLPWLVLHYVTKWKTAATLTTDDEALLDELLQLARRLEDRLETVERLVSTEHPEFRPGQIGHEQQIAQSGADLANFKSMLAGVPANEQPAHFVLPRQGERQVHGGLLRHCHYTGVNALWVRLGFVMGVFMSSGFLLLPYLAVGLLADEAAPPLHRPAGTAVLAARPAEPGPHRARSALAVPRHRPPPGRA